MTITENKQPEDKSGDEMIEGISGKLPAYVFKAQILPDAEHDAMLAAKGIRRIAFVEDASASQLALAIRAAGYPVAMTRSELRADGMAEGRAYRISSVDFVNLDEKINGRALAVLACISGQEFALCTAEGVAALLSRYPAEKVVAEINRHPYRLHSVVCFSDASLPSGGRTVIALGGMIRSPGRAPTPEDVMWALRGAR